MPIIVNLDVMLARRKTRSKELAEQIGISEQNVSLLKSGKVKGVRFETLERIALRSTASPAIFWSTTVTSRTSSKRRGASSARTEKARTGSRAVCRSRLPERFSGCASPCACPVRSSRARVASTWMSC